MEGDLVTDNFDSSLKKYRVHSPATHQSKGQVIALFDAFTAQRAKTFTGGTEVKYKALRGKLLKFFEKEAAIAGVDVALAEKLCEEFTALKPQTQLTYRVLLKAFGAWLVEHGYLEGNPWEKSPKQLKVPPKQRPKPFTQAEVTAILNAFKAHPDYQHYADYARFLLGTGTRIGEAIALQWKHLSDNCTKFGLANRSAGGYVRRPRPTEIGNSGSPQD